MPDKADDDPALGKKIEICIEKVNSGISRLKQFHQIFHAKKQHLHRTHFFPGYSCLKGSIKHTDLQGGKEQTEDQKAHQHKDRKGRREKPQCIPCGQIAETGFFQCKGYSPARRLHEYDGREDPI